MQHHCRYYWRIIKPFNKSLNKLQGFTLIEMIMVIALSGIVVAGSSLLLSHGIREYLINKNNINNSWQASYALERMTRDLHGVAYITTANNNVLTVQDIYGNIINYTFTNNKLFRNALVLANNIQSGNFTYYNADGISTANINAICYIGISLDACSTTVGLWNI